MAVTVNNRYLKYKTADEVQAILEGVEHIDSTPTPNSNNPISSGGVDNALGNYPTKTEMETDLANYPTKTELNTTLGEYSTTEEMNQAIAPLTVTDEEFNAIFGIDGDDSSDSSDEELLNLTM